MKWFIGMVSATNRARLIGIIALAAVVTLAATPKAQSPQEAVIVFYRVRTIEQPKAQTSRIRRIFDRTPPLDPDQNPTIYQMTAGGATRLASIAKGEFFELHVRPGNYVFSWTTGPARGEQTVVSAKAGKRVFVQVQFRSITEVATDAAMTALKDLQPTTDVRVFDSAIRIPPDILSSLQPAASPGAAPSGNAAATQPPSVKEDNTAPTLVQPEIAIRREPRTTTLGSIRQAYVDQPIVVRGSAEQGVLMFWNAARKDGNRYRRDAVSITSKYRGQTANVVAIQLADAGTTPSRPPGAEDDIQNPSFELVAQFPDGTLAMTAATLESLADRAKLVSEQKQREAEMAKNLALVVGKPLYATGLSTLYDPDTTIDDITGSHEILKRLSAARIPLLEPLPILSARYMPAEDGVLIRLRLPGGAAAIAYTNSSLLDAVLPDAPFLQKISGRLLPALPKELTANEIEAIKQGELVRGMSGAAVGYMFGTPDLETNWGAGGKQRIYLKQISVHFDNKDKVVDWQVAGAK